MRKGVRAMKNSSKSKPANDPTGKGPRAKSGKAPTVMSGGTGETTNGGAGDGSRPFSEPDAAVMEMKAWATDYYIAAYQLMYPHWSPEEIRRRAEDEAARDPVTMGFFLPRGERDALLARGMNHFQIESHAILRCLEVPGRRAS